MSSLHEILPAVITSGTIRIDELHPHRNQGLELTYIRSGQLEWLVDGVSEAVHQGMIFFTLPWQAHGSAAPREPANEVCHLLLAMKGSLFRPGGRVTLHPGLRLAADEEEAILSVLGAAERHAWAATPALVWIMESLTGRDLHHTPLEEGRTRNLLNAALYEVARIVSGEASPEATVQDSEERVRLWLLKLGEHCREAWSVDAMALSCGLKRSRFAALTRRVTGYSPLQYLKTLRLRRACALLCHTGKRITEIAFSCGFPSSQQFAKEFRKGTGSTPTAFRRNSKESEGIPPIDWSRIDWRDLDTEQQRVKRLQRV